MHLLILLDTSDARRNLQVYHYLNFNIGPFLNSGLVPILLAPIWVLYGWLYPILDELLEEGSADEVKGLSGSLGSIFITWALLALTFILSDELYLKDIPHWQVTVHVMHTLTCDVVPYSAFSHCGCNHRGHQ